MDPLSRTWWWRVAAVISVIVAVSALALYDVPGLIDGASASDDPYWVLLGSFASDVLALVAAYGAWRRQVWGVVLLIVVNVFWIVQTVTTLFDPSHGMDVAIALVMTAVHVLVLWCCLGPRRATAPGPERLAGGETTG
ncbi:hypothetical protein BH10ACT3_BH10ACT3_24170 [soil metagenome]